MAGRTITGTKTPNATVNAYRAARFRPYSNVAILPEFPGTGVLAPASPDATATANAQGAYSLTTSTQEDFVVAILDGNGKVAYHSLATWVEPPHSTSTSGIVVGALGAPSNANGNDGEFYHRSDGGALTSIYQKRANVWVGIV